MAHQRMTICLYVLQYPHTREMANSWLRVAVSDRTRSPVAKEHSGSLKRVADRAPNPEMATGTYIR